MEQLNGVDQWEVIMGDANSVRRSGLLINIDEVLRTEGIIGLDHWKLVLNEDGHGRHDGFMGDSGRGGSETYDGLALLSCPAATAFATLHGALNLSTVIATRTRAEVACPQRTQHAPSNLTGTPPCANYCLYDLQVRSNAFVIIVIMRIFLNFGRLPIIENKTRMMRNLIIILIKFPSF